MGILTFLKFLLPLLLSGLKEITIPKRPTEESRTSVGIRVSILVIIGLLFSMGFVTDKLYVVHTEKVNLGAQVIILTANLQRCKLNIENLDKSIGKSGKTKSTMCPMIRSINVTKPTKVVKQPPQRPDYERDKMVSEINQL